MAEFKFSCPQCGQQIQCDTGYSGTQINCPACQQAIVVPQVPGSAARPPVPAKSCATRNVLIIAAAVVVFAGLVIGGWFGYSKNKFHKVVEAGLVAYYPLNGNANDASGNGNDGRVVGAIPCKDRFGNTDAAFSFNGADNYISFKSVPLKKLDNWSLSAWINPASLNQYATAVCLGFDDGNTGDGFAFGMTKDNYNAGNHLTGVLGGVKWIPSGYTFPSANRWYHVVMLRSDGVTKFYVNGIQTANTESSTPLAPTAFTIGSATRGRFFDGMIDDVRIYNRALSASEIQAIYTEQK
jgi:DNA-directed RNA polymerase subunit RPC12/RpoP